MNCHERRTALGGRTVEALKGTFWMDRGDPSIDNCRRATTQAIRIAHGLALSERSGWAVRAEDDIVAVPDLVDALPAILATAPKDAALERSEGHWDTAAGVWGRGRAYIHVPSLVQHLNESSLLGHPLRPGGIPRRSRTFPGTEVSAWEYTVVSPD